MHEIPCPQSHRAVRGNTLKIQTMSNPAWQHNCICCQLLSMRCTWGCHSQPTHLLCHDLVKDGGSVAVRLAVHTCSRESPASGSGNRVQLHGRINVRALAHALTRLPPARPAARRTSWPRSGAAAAAAERTAWRMKLCLGIPLGQGQQRADGRSGRWKAVHGRAACTHPA